MSTDHCNRFDRLDALIQRHGNKGIRVLLLFKLLKNKVKERLAKRPSSKGINDNIVSLVCMNKAIELAELGVEMPTEENITELLSELDRKDNDY